MAHMQRDSLNRSWYKGRAMGQKDVTEAKERSRIYWTELGS